MLFLMLDTEGIHSLCLKILLLADSEAKNSGEEPAAGRNINYSFF